MVRFSGPSAWVLALCVTSGCVPAGAPYRFNSPLLGGVAAREPWHGQANEPAHENRPGHRLVPLRKKPEPLVRDTETELPLPGKGEDLAAFLRMQVGTRDKRRNHTQFALGTLLALGLELPGVDDTSDGPTFVEHAMERHATSTTRRPRLGDIVVFDDVVGDKAASLLGVVISTDNQGTTEFLYLGRGVVRRGFVNPGQPARPRDPSGRALNTFIRHSDGKDPIGTRFLAGQLFSTFVATDKLAVSRAVAALAR